MRRHGKLVYLPIIFTGSYETISMGWKSRSGNNFVLTERLHYDLKHISLKTSQVSPAKKNNHYLAQPWSSQHTGKVH